MLDSPVDVTEPPTPDLMWTFFPNNADSMACDDLPESSSNTPRFQAMGRPFNAEVIAGELNQRLQSLHLSQKQGLLPTGSGGWDATTAGGIRGVDVAFTVPDRTAPAEARTPELPEALTLIPSAVPPPPKPIADRPARGAKRVGQVPPPSTVGALPAARNKEIAEAQSDAPRLPSTPGPEAALDLRPEIVISIGSVGHPLACNKACKYARRKGGCMHGAECLECHECQWRREPDASRKDAEVSELSLGSRGHPNGCAKPCRYVWQKAGCRNGSNCSDCHMCQWSRRSNQLKDHKLVDASKGTSLSDQQQGANIAVGEAFFVEATPVEKVPAVEAFPVETTPVLKTDLQFCPTLGSVGHPFACSGLGCKYVNKARGCKDGHLCKRCHLCAWRRKQ